MSQSGQEHGWFERRFALQDPSFDGLLGIGSGTLLQLSQTQTVRCSDYEDGDKIQNAVVPRRQFWCARSPRQCDTGGMAPTAGESVRLLIPTSSLRCRSQAFVRGCRPKLGAGSPPRTSGTCGFLVHLLLLYQPLRASPTPTPTTLILKITMTKVLVVRPTNTYSETLANGRPLLPRSCTREESMVSSRGVYIYEIPTDPCPRSLALECPSDVSSNGRQSDTKAHRS